MGKHQLRLLIFLLRYNEGWHSYGTDSTTVAAVNALTKYGLIEISDSSRQMRIKLGNNT